ncbi:MAG: hypothetical protein OQJ97_12230 [Rhodospirillales bacterium]|nr:hypothetical protein [Rhodospirillales bacterium]
MTRFLIIGLIPFVLAGCSIVENAYEDVMGKSYRPTVCPRISILAEASDLTKFKTGPGRDIIDQTVESNISGVDVTCKYDLEEDTSGTLNVGVVLHFEATMGPANKVNKAVLPYFLAVVDNEKNILEREAFTQEIYFKGNIVKASFQDEPVQFILPLKRGEDGSDFEIYAGFQLTQEEVKYNRRRLTR